MLTYTLITIWQWICTAIHIIIFLKNDGYLDHFHFFLRGAGTAAAGFLFRQLESGALHDLDGLIALFFFSLIIIVLALALRGCQNHLLHGEGALLFRNSRI